MHPERERFENPNLHNYTPKSRASRQDQFGKGVHRFGISTAESLVGLFFGIWPALKAAKLDSITTLRCEQKCLIMDKGQMPTIVASKSACLIVNRCTILIGFGTKSLATS
jgi:hypothetical protein